MFETQNRVVTIFETINKTKGTMEPVTKNVEKTVKGLRGMNIENVKWIPIQDAINESMKKEAEIGQKISSVFAGKTALTKEELTQLRQEQIASNKYTRSLIQRQRAGEKWIPVQKKTTQGLQAFRMEMLSVMFFGMGIQRMFMGWISPAMEAFGVFELWNTMLTVVFVPIMETIFPFLLNIMMWFMDLPGPVKILIGAIAILGVIFGTILMVFGTLVLGLSGMAMAFGIAGGAAGVWGVITAGATGIVTAAMGPLLPIILAIGIAIGIMYFVWRDNLFGVRDIAKVAFSAIMSVLGVLWNYFKLVFSGIVSIIEIAWGIIKIPLNFIAGFFSALINSLLPGTGSAWSKLWDFIKNVVVGVWSFIKPIFDAITGFLKWIIDGLSWLAGIAGGLGRALGGAIGGIFGGRAYQYGGIVPGPVGRPVPVLAHGGERFLGVREGGGAGQVIYFNPIYNIEVSDRAEMESLIKKQNDDMVSELKRMIK